MEELDLFGSCEVEEDNKYTSKVNVPQYLPSEECPKLSECFNLTKYKELIRNINLSNISDEDKEFLRFAASRHIVFNYSKIADYYAHANKEMQELMEQSALVIIDIDDAIANGYVKFSKAIDNIMKSTGRVANEEYKNQARDTRRDD